MERFMVVRNSFTIVMVAILLGAIFISYFLINIDNYKKKKKLEYKNKYKSKR